VLRSQRLKYALDFTPKCSGSGAQTYYAYVFSRAGRSRFHLLLEPVTRTARRISFRAAPVTISGRAVACDPRGYTYLVISYKAINFDLECLPPAS
jgi:hypothetical protein